MASNKPPKVVTIPDEEEEEEDWTETHPVNMAEAKHYTDHINDIFNTMADMLHDNKDALP